MTADWIGACRIAAHRIGVRFAAGLCAVAALCVIAVAGLERRTAPLTAADNTLLGIVFGLGIPLCTYAVAGRVTASLRWLESTEALARYGANRRVLALGSFAVTAAFSSIAGGVLATVGVVSARSVSDRGYVSDVVVSLGLGVLAGVVYAAWFVLGSTFGRRGRFVALAVDWLLGSSTTAVALPLPRGHLQNLLGAEPLLTMTQRQASVALALLASIYVGIALWRTPP